MQNDELGNFLYIKEKKKIIHFQIEPSEEKEEWKNDWLNEVNG